MNRYTVISVPDAEDDLASIWMADEDRDRVTAAADAADRLLAQNPILDSVHLSEQLRRRDIPPLRFYYEVREDDRLVVIGHVVRLPD